MLIEDDPAIIKVLSVRLRAIGYAVATAEDGETGYNLARSQQPDLIILDLMLPKMDGLQVASALKKDNNYQDIPILMLTARASEEDKQRGIAAGASVYMTKPFDSKILLQNIKTLLEDFSKN